MNNNQNCPAPEIIQWLTTLKCPHECKHCFAYSPDGCNELDYDQAISLLNQIKAMNVEQIIITGGEPAVRKDLPELIRHLGIINQLWTLNTSVLPGQSLQNALVAAPPVGTVLSLDGPEAIHDEFRARKGSFNEILEAVRFYKSIGNGHVEIGTTISEYNLKHLDKLYEIIRKNNIEHWGIHLPVPEGRAKGNSKLSLSRRQIKKLMLWVVEKRKEFPVVLTDSFGSCGEFEHLVRNSPLKCGAGTKQCVILPDGEVVPCLTLDRSCSAGNILKKSLSEIWNNGFSDLRNWQDLEKCNSCKQAETCRGGCWLMRKNGIVCDATSWKVPEFIKKAATVTIVAGAFQALPCAAQGNQLETAILNWYTGQLSPDAADINKIKPPLPANIQDDPGYIFFLNHKENKLPDNLMDLCSSIDKALKSKFHSPSLIALCRRTIADACIKSAPEKRTEAEKTALLATNELLHKYFPEWKKETKNQSPPGSLNPRFGGDFLVKHIARPFQQIVTLPKLPSTLVDDLNAERSAKLPYLQYSLILSPEKDSLFSFVTSKGKSSVKTGHFMGIFETISTSEKEGTLNVAGFVEKSSVFSVKVPPNTDLTYIDLIRLVYEQNKK